MDSQREKEQFRTYERPAIKTLTVEQAMPFLRHHAALGDSGAQDLLTLLKQQE